MLPWLLKLLLPYYFLAVTGSYSLMQNLQAMGWMSIWQGPLIDLQGTINLLSGGYMVLLPLLFVLNILAAWVLSTRLALIAVALWLLPCLLGLFDLYLFTPVVPSRYVIGSGGDDQLGSVEGALVNSVIILLIGWSLSTLILHLMEAGKKSKSAFDHFWYLLGLTAIVFFVSDNGHKGTADDLAEGNQELGSAFTLLTHQVEREFLKCADTDFTATHPQLCAWLKQAHVYLSSAAQANWVERKYSDAPEASVLFGLLQSSGVDGQQVIATIRAYNRQQCQGGSDDDLHCREVPVEMNKHPDLLSGLAGVFDRSLLAVEAIMPHIHYLWKKSVNAQIEVEAQKSTINKRWAYLALVFPLFIGIKVSHSSREFFGGREEPVLRQGIKAWVRGFWVGLTVSILLLVMLSLYVLGHLYQLIARRG